MTSNKWTLRKALRTLLVGLLSIVLAYALARLMFTFEIASYIFSFIGIMVLVLCFGILLYSLLIDDDEPGEKKPDDFSWRHP